MTPTDLWYGSAPAARALAAVLAPLGWLYCGVAAARAAAYRRGWLASFDAGAPVLVVGNLSVGGTGKTPLVRWLAGHLADLGLRPGIASRGYAAADNVASDVRVVPVDADPAAYGDEPVLLAADGAAPVAVGRDRVAAARALVHGRGCNAVITDDGLQHYRLRRQCEILVVDGERGHGNGRCLPAGPLREPVGRADRVDLVIATGGGQPGLPAMTLEPRAAVSLSDPGDSRPLRAFAGRRITAVAGIGNPGRFFRMLAAHGIGVDARLYPDHHRFAGADIAAWGEGPVLMTEKDAVKVRRLPPAGRLRPDLWYVPVMAVPAPGFVADLDRLLARRGILPTQPAGAGG
ncbi:MAG: tetraacyldisaccharide 4'-kinase [Thiohalocapsa sp.]|jgi:tetraacyldisaccharide 4'-kinase|uniref:tetraacyldisaccharide 4'-kinase n=1 Tax=Thiohalocapsa sp. TaxID=2497641 RepID=UPI0025E76E61|nr:tetraacyldisaccharide 4'-kinase [Thiohalocapsa sp.]MCG6940068.1 tetraacyldisaccharide 4'-kinase [Thiohalocapsa sp.]